MVALYLAAEVKFMAIEFQLKAYDLWDTRGSFEKKKKKNNLLQKAIFSGLFDLRLTKVNNWFSGHIS